LIKVTRNWARSWARSPRSCSWSINQYYYRWSRGSGTGGGNGCGCCTYCRL